MVSDTKKSMTSKYCDLLASFQVVYIVVDQTNTSNVSIVFVHTLIACSINVYINSEYNAFQVGDNVEHSEVLAITPLILLQ